LGLVFLSAAGLCEAKEFVVGGQSGWKIPSSPDEYNCWAGENRFKIGYILVFKYPCNNDSVLEVNEDDYKNCNTKNPIKSYNSNGNTEVVLERSGAIFFISGQDDHCENGQKLAVVVLSPKHTSPGSPPPVALPPEANSNNGPPMVVATVCGRLALLLLPILFY
ncbi:PREDICTED: early nodulin-like protein 1, partial [Ipomoea nil]|uniref:early nodulin-like protein 1 n=1 Tax=Ipomoea nil TaxID=35883 RepID=UPI0009008B3A